MPAARRSESPLPRRAARLAALARPGSGTCWRVVEGQHHVSTLPLVDTLAEQARLEQLFEATKPSLPP